jgi:hypothetical protein
VVKCSRSAGFVTACGQGMAADATRHHHRQVRHGDSEQRCGIEQGGVCSATDTFNADSNATRFSSAGFRRQIDALATLLEFTQEASLTVPYHTPGSSR